MLSVIAGVAGTKHGTDLAADPRVAPWLTERQKQTMTGVFPTPHPETLPVAMAAARALHEAGVPLPAGTDANGPGTAHGVSIHGELQLPVRAGLAPSDALAAATALPARHFGLRDRGRVARGMRADLVLVDGDPTVRIGDTLSIRRIRKNGYPVDRRPTPTAP